MKPCKAAKLVKEPFILYSDITPLPNQIAHHYIIYTHTADTVPLPTFLGVTITLVIIIVILLILITILIIYICYKGSSSGMCNYHTVYVLIIDRYAVTSNSLTVSALFEV